ncbi:uncharacterized protein LDX57_008842 [Aspergillus melleus]|uniref:uncharacterized protein n=1 Tax=Aspergillus melleus TaxID=138277 RepID=UPI001E8CBBA6|nr:uncharacterized protein LDX57_008842 [Aspergillus melleus]KAH8431183.1 hypothetical protein LDX57_008842 [Aspergillus melleus]
MSPAPVAADMQTDHSLQTLARAFEALLLTAQQLSCKEKSLQQRLKYANNEYMKLADRLPDGPDTHTKIVSEKILGRYTEYDHTQKEPSNPQAVVKSLAESGNVGEQALSAITDGLACYQTVVPSQEGGLMSDLNQCVVATRAGAPRPLEKDFTTRGMKGSLRCPFAKSRNKTSENGVSNGVEDRSNVPNDACGHEDLDPIKAEQKDKQSVHTPSARSSTTQCQVSRCPIRFLDQHSPEEVADYVERHKHEIPRSHAICVQRYQKDSSSMRQLDAKYGNLISMIRGLSVKHQAFLPRNGQSDGPTSSSSAERVEKWAEDVGLKSEMQPSIKEEEEEGEERKGHFDRPLREVRVGESPSRPWGIPVPIPLPAAPAGPHSPAAPVPASLSHPSPKSSDNADADVSSIAPLQGPSHDTADAAPPAPKTGRCPFGHGAPPADHLAPETETIRNPDPINDTPEDTTGQDYEAPPEFHGPSGNPTASVVFNGPVFFGFSPDQTAAFLQQLGRLGHNPA